MVLLCPDLSVPHIQIFEISDPFSQIPVWPL